MDDVSEKNELAGDATAASMDNDTLAMLKAKLEAKKEQEKKSSVQPKVIEKTRGINFGVVGSGQGGSRLAEEWYRLGYDAVVVNTAQQDLKYIELPTSNKLLLEFGLGGAAKSLDIGKAAAEAHRAQIADLINNQLADAQLFVFCTSLGGGSGAGSVETIIDVLSEVGKPVIVIGVLPMDADDVQAKNNSLQTLEKLLKEIKAKRIANLFVVDNAKIETIFAEVSQMNFFGVANKAIVEPLHVFNTMSIAPSLSKPLDPMELGKILVDGEGFTVYGHFDVHNYEEETAIAEAVISNLDNNLLSSGFSIDQTRYCGFILKANKSVWDKIKSSNINYALAVLQDKIGAGTIYKGYYQVDDDQEDCLKVYSIFSGLGLPTARVDQLTKEAKAQSEVVKAKDVNRNMTLSLDLGKNETISEAQRIKDKIAVKSSTFGKFLTQTVVDRRKS